jgi:hypothetical protein
VPIPSTEILTIEQIMHMRISLTRRADTPAAQPHGGGIRATQKRQLDHISDQGQLGFRVDRQLAVAPEKHT